MSAGKLHLIYVAGKYSAGTPEQVERNIRVAQSWAAAINRTGLGVFAVVPHSLSRNIESSLDEETWRAGTLALSRRCDGLVLLPEWQESAGSLGELAAAKLDGRPYVAATAIPQVESTVRELIAALGVRMVRQAMRRGNC